MNLGRRSKGQHALPIAQFDARNPTSATKQQTLSGPQRPNGWWILAAAAQPSRRTTLATEGVNKWVTILKELGVLGWNRRRKEFPSEVPNFTSVDFTDERIWKGSSIWKEEQEETGGGKGKSVAVLYENDVDDPHRRIGIDLAGAVLNGAILKGARLQNASLSDARLRGANLSHTDLTGADLTRADLYGAILDRTRFTFAVLDYAWLDRAKKVAAAEYAHASMIGAWFSTTGERTGLEGVDFSDCDLSFARLERADLSGANLRRASLRGAILQGAYFAPRNNKSAATLYEADLREADMSQTNIRKCDLRDSRWGGARTTGIVFGSLRGRVRGAGGLDDIYGSSRFRKALRDQEAIDSMHAAAEEGPIFDAPRAIVRAVLLALVLYAAAVTAGSATGEPMAAYATVTGIGLGVFSATRLGMRLLMWLWSGFDYGRSITLVGIFAAFCIGSFGLMYKSLEGKHFIIALPDETCRTLDGSGAVSACTELDADLNVSKHPAYPWFVALMGFCTLSITDLIFPSTGLGQLVIMGNVLSGFLTLGLLLAVLADRFARRN